MDFTLIIYIILGILPSLIWLFYYSSKDLHPEPKKMILKIFLWGAIATVPVLFVQLGLAWLLGRFSLNPLVNALLYWFLVIAFSEEFFKYLVIKMHVVNSPHLDEPFDVILYMVISALGFAAVENTLYLFSPMGQMSFAQSIDRVLLIDLIRFVGAVLLHTLCSAVIGYSLAISFYETNKKNIIVVTGILAAIALHGLYDYYLMTSNGYIQIAIPAGIVLVCALIIFSGFGRIKKMKSVGKI
jgi:RsiW-degrading membrane proteinase PrsW (M82 family)